MLQAHQHGYTFGHFIRINAKRHLILITVSLLLIYLAMWIQDGVAFYVLIGRAIGTFVRDFAWFRSNRASWSFIEKITDWQKVEKLANDEPSP